MLGMRLSHKYCLICSAESTRCVKNGANIMVKMLKFRVACWTQIRGQKRQSGVLLFALSVST